MIGKMMIGKGFSGCISYCLEDKKMLQDKDKLIVQNRAEILYYNQCFGNKKELIKQFNEVRKLNAKQSRPVLHITLSMAPGELLERGQLLDIVQHSSREFGFNENQFLAVEHTDTHHQHVHIIANRIGFAGRTNVSDSNNYKRMAAFCRKMEREFKLQQVLSPRRFLHKQQQQIPRNDQRKQQIKSRLMEVLSQSKSMEAFCQNAKALGLDVIKSRGISFIDEKGVKIKGSEMGLSLQTIERKLELQNQKEVLKETQFIKIKQRQNYLSR
ncbi:relaxase/mobilization nuclease domain-containing protein [Niabella insulamsoli]|uniref:relaxase/mobilization nuclease domain-containing protein n=1 Tax=Niabella insulamsoli TaxID=3144874 RepID=UPI0031FD0CB6